MYKPVLTNYFNHRKMYLEKGKYAILIGEVNGEKYRIREYIGMVKEIKPPVLSNMSRIVLQFEDNVILQTEVYLDNDIQIGDIISIYGIVTKDLEENFKLNCKCGVIKVYGRLDDVSRVNIKKIYKFGYAETSEIEESMKIPKSMEKYLVELEAGKLWFGVFNSISELEKLIKKVEEEEKNYVDFTSKQFAEIPQYQEK